MVTGTGLGLGNKMLKQDGLGLCLQMGTDQKGERRAKALSQECDQAFKGVYSFSILMTLRFEERPEFRIFGGGGGAGRKDCLLGPWRGNVLPFSHFARAPWPC